MLALNSGSQAGFLLECQGTEGSRHGLGGGGETSWSRCRKTAQVNHSDLVGREQVRQALGKVMSSANEEFIFMLFCIFSVFSSF